jgi:hypothetical protein
MNIEYPSHITAVDIADAKVMCLDCLNKGYSKIDGIRYLRARLGIGLKDAKDLFESEIDQRAIGERLDANRIRDASPDLLAALQALRREAGWMAKQLEHRGLPGRPGDSVDLALIAADEAIAKAQPDGPSADADIIGDDQ